MMNVAEIYCIPVRRYVVNVAETFYIPTRRYLISDIETFRIPTRRYRMSDTGMCAYQYFNIRQMDTVWDVDSENGCKKNDTD